MFRTSKFSYFSLLLIALAIRHSSELPCRGIIWETFTFFLLCSHDGVFMFRTSKLSYSSPLLIALFIFLFIILVLDELISKLICIHAETIL